jgi:hypothetical protein
MTTCKGNHFFFLERKDTIEGKKKKTENGVNKNKKLKLNES